MTNYKPYVIVIGNEKGGAGKTTTAMHFLISLLRLNFKVSTIDLDLRQKSLTRYIENRELSAKKNNYNILMPNHHIVLKTDTLSTEDLQHSHEEEMFLEQLEQLNTGNDFIIIDTPGSNSFLSRLAHSFADTVITPMNDSFVDLDVIANINADNLSVERSSIYSQMLWEQKMQRARRDQREIDWIVLRNRLSSIGAKNKRNIADVLEKLSKRLGFRVAEGFSERVIFRELFLSGLTVLDLKEISDESPLSMSHIAAKQELNNFLKFFNNTRVNEALKNLQSVTA